MMNNNNNMLEMQSTSSLSSKKMQLSSSTLKSWNNSASTNEIQRSQSIQSLQLSSRLYVILSDISKSSLLSSENLKQLERSKNNVVKKSHRKIRSLKRYSSSSSISSFASSNSSGSSIRYISRSSRRLRDRNFIAKIKNQHYLQKSERKLRKSTVIDTQCSLASSHQRQSIINKYLSNKSINNDTFSLDRPSRIIDDDTDDDDNNLLININIKNNLPAENIPENLPINHNDTKSQTSSVLFALLASPPASPLKIGFSDINQEENDNPTPSTSCDVQLNTDVDPPVEQKRIPPLVITRERLNEVKAGKRRTKKDKKDKERRDKKRSRTALTKNNNEDKNNSSEVTSEDNKEPVPEITTTADKQLPKNININNNINNITKNISNHLQPKLRFHSKTEALESGLIEKNQRIINERKGLPVKKIIRKPKKVTKPKKKYVKKVQDKKAIGRPRKNKKAATPATVAPNNIVDDTPYVEYEDGRKLPSLPLIETASRNKDEELVGAGDDDADFSCSSTSTEVNPFPMVVAEFNRMIGLGAAINADKRDEDMSEHVVEIKFCTEDVDENGGTEKKFDQFLVKCQKPVVNELSMETIKPTENIEDVEHRSFGELKPNLRKRIPRIVKKPPIIVEDKILPMGTVNVELLNTAVAEMEPDRVKKPEEIVNRKRKNVFAPDVAKKRKLLHSSEFNPPNESGLKSYGIRTTVPSRQSLLPTKKVLSSEEMEKLNCVFKEWAKIPEIFEMINSNSTNKETIEPKINVKERLRDFVDDNNKKQIENKKNGSETSIDMPKTVETLEEISKTPENTSCKIKTTKLSENILQEINHSQSTPRNESKVQTPLDTTRNNTFERVPTGNNSTVIRTSHKRSLNEEKAIKLRFDTKRSRWKREYAEDSDSSSSSELKMAASYSSSYNKFEEKSINSYSSSTISTKSITQRLTEWSKIGTEVQPIEMHTDDNSNCHSPSSVKTVVNVPDSDYCDRNLSVSDGKNEDLTEKLDNQVDVNVNMQNSRDNDDNDDSSSSSNSSSCASSCSNSTTNSLSTTSGFVESLQNQQNNESINNNLNVEEEAIKEVSCVPEEISNKNKNDNDNIMINIINVPDDEERNDDDDDDDDAISLCAPTMDDIVLDDTDLQSLREDESFYSTSSSRPYKRMKSANIGRFVSENVREFDALYDDTSNNIYDVTTKRVGTRWVPTEIDNSHSNVVFDFNNQHQPLNFKQPIATTSRIQTRLNNNNNTNNNNNEMFNDAKYKFRGQCFSTLKRNNCANTNCKFEHTVRSKLLFLHMENTKQIKSTLIYAIAEKFFHYLKLVYDNSIKKLNTMEIMEVFNKLIEQSFPNIIREFINSTLQAFSSRSKKIQLFIDFISNTVQQSTSTADDNIPLILIEALSEFIEPGKCWESLRNLILKLAFPSQQIIEKILIECTKYPKSMQHIRDIEMNIIKRLDENILIKIDSTIIAKFNKVVDDSKSSENFGYLQTQEIDSLIIEDEILDSSSIASPDTTTTNNNNNNDNNNNINVESDNNICSHLSKKISTDLRSRLGVRKADTTLEWKLIKIDNISQPCSLFKNEMWLFHKDFDLLKESLVRKDYDAVSRTLEITKRSFKLDKNKINYTRNFYRILCKTILETPEHLEQIILTTVQNGIATTPDFLQMLLNVGINILKKLIHIGAWIVAHRMLKVLLHYYGGTNNVCNNNRYNNVTTTALFVLLSVEIYIANRQPLKAFDLIKQNNLMTKERSAWKVSSDNEDETLRLLILNLLLKSLCLDNVDYAFCMFTTILKDQKSVFSPLDLSKYTDSIIFNLITYSRDDCLMKMVDLMLDCYLIASPIIIRAMIVKIFHLDHFLSRQLHKYALENRIYPSIQCPIRFMSFILPINLYWTEEEMFLMMEEYLQMLRDRFGDNTNKIKSRQLILYLNFELFPSFTQLHNDDINDNNAINNVELIVNAKRAMKNVLERFDPVIKFQTRTPDQRLCKFINYTVVNYLKAQLSED